MPPETDRDLEEEGGRGVTFRLSMETGFRSHAGRQEHTWHYLPASAPVEPPLGQLSVSLSMVCCVACSTFALLCQEAKLPRRLFTLLLWYAWDAILPTPTSLPPPLTAAFFSEPAWEKKKEKGRKGTGRQAQDQFSWEELILGCVTSWTVHSSLVLSAEKMSCIFLSSSDSRHPLNF